MCQDKQVPPEPDPARLLRSSAVGTQARLGGQKAWRPVLPSFILLHSGKAESEVTRLVLLLSSEEQYSLHAKIPFGSQPSSLLILIQR